MIFTTLPRSTLLAKSLSSPVRTFIIRSNTIQCRNSSNNNQKVAVSFQRRLLSSGKSAEKATATTAEGAGEGAKKGIWNDVNFWATAGAIAGWGMSGAAIYDSLQSGPEVISLNMTGVLMVYSSLFARWAWIVQPRNTLLAACHATNVIAQTNQMRRALEYKIEQGQQDEVNELMTKAGMVGAATVGCVAFGPTLQRAIVNAKLGPVSDVAGAAAGPFTVHFWAPMSKWLISGASFVDLNRPTDKVSLPQYSALTATGFFFSRYALLVTPINYVLCSVNIALFGSSFYHLARKIKADFL